MKSHVKRLRRLFADKRVPQTESPPQTKSPPQTEEKLLAYDPLDEKSDSIRLLKVLPGTRSDGVWCVLERIPLRHLPSLLCVVVCMGSSTSLRGDQGEWEAV